MPYETRTFIVLIASPSDLPEERQAAKQAIYEWNALHAKAEQITLDPHMWETHATPGYGRPQGIINEQLVRDADLLVGMFWTKIGTVTTGAVVSGTVEEIDQIVASGRPALLYFSTRAIDQSMIDPKQWEGLKVFKQDTYAKALVGSFASPDELRQKLKDDLTRCIREMKKPRVVEIAKPHVVSRTSPSGDRVYAMMVGFLTPVLASLFVFAAKLVSLVIESKLTRVSVVETNIWALVTFLVSSAFRVFTDGRTLATGSEGKHGVSKSILFVERIVFAILTLIVVLVALKGPEVCVASNLDSLVLWGYFGVLAYAIMGYFVHSASIRTRGK